MNSSTESVLAIVVTYNRLDKLKECLEHLAAQTVTCEVLVVDNASTDGTTAWFNGSHFAQDERFHYLQLTDNSGGAGGFAAGMREALRGTYDWLWLMDDDAYPQPEALEQLLALPIDQHIGVLACKVVDKNGQLPPVHRPATYAWGRGTLYEVPEEKLLGDEPVHCDVSSFVGFMVRTQVVRLVGLPRADYFIHFDDVEYSLRIRQACYQLLVVPHSVIAHQVIILQEQGVTPAGQLWKLYYNRRNELYTSLRYSQGLLGKSFFMARRIVKLGQRSVMAIGHDHPRLRLQIEWRAFRDGVLGRLGKKIDPAGFRIE